MVWFPYFTNVTNVTVIVFVDLCQFSLMLYLAAKVMEAVTDAGMTQVEEEVVVDTVAVAAATSMADQDLTPPAPPKKRLVETDAEVRRL